MLNPVLYEVLFSLIYLKITLEIAILFLHAFYTYNMDLWLKKICLGPVCLL